MSRSCERDGGLWQKDSVCAKARLFSSTVFTIYCVLEQFFAVSLVLSGGASRHHAELDEPN
jgi:hypothetical protein